MSSFAGDSTIQTNDLCSLGEELLETFIKKGRDSVIKKYENGEENFMEKEDEYPNFFKMLNTDASQCDKKWIVDFNQQISSASDDDIKKFAKPAIDMLSSIIYFLVTKNKSEKKYEGNDNQIDDKNHKDHSRKQIDSKCGISKNCYYYDEEFENDEILKELTEGLDPKYIDPEFNMIHSATIKRNQFDDYSLYGDGSKIYKTQDNVH